jgi:hypothetical protein
MKGNRMFVAVLTLGLALGMALMASLGMAQGPAPQDVAAPQDSVSGEFTYQGRLKDASGLVNDTCDLQFSLWDATGSGSPPTGGNQVGTPRTQTNVAVADGLFTVALDFGNNAFNGEARWLQIGVRCPAGSGAYMPLTPRQALTAAPYALSLQPGAVVKGTAYQSFRVDSHAPTGGIPAAIVGTVNEATDGVALFGRNYKNSAGATGMGVWGISDSPAGMGVFGQATGAGTGVMAQSVSGKPIQAFGGSPAAEVFHIESTGSVAQAREANGLLKAAVYAFCSDSGSTIYRSFNNVNGATITILDGNDTGSCILDFGFDVVDRYWVVSAVPLAGSDLREVGCLHGPLSPAEELACFGWTANDGTKIASYIMVLIY